MRGATARQASQRTPQSNGPGPVSDDGPHWSGISVPVIVGFNLFESGNPNPFGGPRFASAWKGRGVVDPSTDAFGWHGALSLGVAWM